MACAAFVPQQPGVGRGALARIPHRKQLQGSAVCGQRQAVRCVRQAALQQHSSQAPHAALPHARCAAARRLSVRLSRPVAGNAVLVKLVSQEDMMHLFHDQHDWPNIDMSHVGLSGKTVRLPPGVSLAR